MDGIELRAARPDELEAVSALTVRADRFDGVPQVYTLEELRQDLDADYVDLADDTRVAVRDGELVGWAWVDNPPAEGRLDRAVVFGTVDPDHRGRGVGRQLLGWGVERSTERLRQHVHDLARVIRTYAYDWQESNRRLYGRFGFAPVRYFEELARPLTDLPTAPAPAGVTLVPWPQDRDAELRAIRDSAFADHWGTVVLDDNSWASLVRGKASRLDLSVAAVDDATGVLVGLCLNHVYPEDEEVTGRREAVIDNLATLAPWRGRGVASAMIAWSLAAFAADGRDHALLSVDSDNPTGAARLYRNLGFEPQNTTVAYEIELKD